MSTSDNITSSDPIPLMDHPVTVLLVDDQPIIGEAVRRMLVDESGVSFHFCNDPAKAIEMANQLSPTVILQDLVMPEIDGLTLVKFFRANPSTREVPLIVLSTKEEPIIKAQAFAVGANDYLVKLPDKLELVARIRYHSKGYIAQLERNEAYRKLAASEKQLADEVAQAAKYVCSLLPPPIKQGPVQVDWRFVPSTQLGGDSFGYHWLEDDEHFAVYLLDVSGHGVGASLLSVSALNVLRSQSLPGTNFHDPAQVLERLSTTFLMEQHDNRYFTIWYAVFSTKTRQLAYASGGHPPALLMTSSDSSDGKLKQLEAEGSPIGWNLGLPFEANVVTLDPSTRVFIFSDGVYEIEKTDGENWTLDEFHQFMATVPQGVNSMDHLLAHTRQLHGSDVLADDFSMLELVF